MEAQTAGKDGGGPGDSQRERGPGSEIDPATATPRRDRDNVPGWLRTGAGYSWRLLLLAAALYLLGRVLGHLYIVVVPCTAALLLTALLEPLAERLRKHGWGPMSSTWTALLAAIIVVAGMGVLITNRVQAEYPSLVIQVRHTSTQIEHWLAGAPFHLHTANVESILGNVTRYLSQHRSAVEGTVVTGGRIVAETLAGLVLMFFVTFFLMKDGDQIWNWLTGGFRAESKERVDRAGHAAWKALVFYIRGTVVVAAIHATVMAITLTAIGAPLVAPLALLMFVGAFIPIVGALVAGVLAVLVVLAAKGLLLALIVVVVLVVMNQVESHLLQPQVVGKMLHLHPLAVILVLAIGGVVAGIFGAMIAVPLTAAISRAATELHRSARPSP
ncbi:MAG: AI-2E family transporter [Streptosporangiales bacterium]|jgi:predicted PurR-regulated permease PerM|nr:AI-2E family transporter [Streptosporangiales bacterium]